MLSYRLLALDLDGTTLTESKEISLPTKKWINKAIENGVVVSLSTGRGRQTADVFRVQLGLTSPMVYLNGAELWKTTDVLLERHFINSNDIFRLYQLAKSTDSWFWGFTIDRFVRKQDWNHECLSGKWMKFGFLNNNVTVIKELHAVIKSWGNLEVTQSADNNLEISLKGITKEHGIRKVCSLIGIGLEEVIAIGDSQNDLQLIKSVGLGVAMGNATTEVKCAADVITATNEEDGVAKAIANYLFKTEYRI